MSDIFREVDEALQQEKLEKIWKEYGSTIITSLVVLVLSTAIMTAYRGWDAGRNAEETARLMQALETQNPAENIQTIIEDTRKNHRALGLMISAGLLAQDGKDAEAAAMYQEAATSGSTPKDLRDLARILSAQSNTEGAMDILKPVLANNKSPWIWNARIEAAIIAAHQDQDFKTALTYLVPFEDVTTIPPSLKQRGQALAHVYRIKAAQKNDRPKAAE